MKPTLAPGARTSLTFTVPVTKTVPRLYPESPEFQEIPAVFATGFMVGLIEWTCIKVLEPHLEPGEGSLGTAISVTHSAATLPGQIVTVDAECAKVDGRRVEFKVSAHDGIDKIGEGTHARIVVAWDRFKARVNEKARRAGVSGLT